MRKLIAITALMMTAAGCRRELDDGLALRLEIEEMNARVERYCHRLCVNSNTRKRAVRVVELEELIRILTDGR